MRYFILYFIFLTLFSASYGQSLYSLKTIKEDSLTYINSKSKKDTVVSIHNLVIDTCLLQQVTFKPFDISIRRRIVATGAAWIIDRKKGNIWEGVAEDYAERKNLGIWSIFKDCGIALPVFTQPTMFNFQLYIDSIKGINDKNKKKAPGIKQKVIPLTKPKLPPEETFVAHYWRLAKELLDYSLSYFFIALKNLQVQIENLPGNYYSLTAIILCSYFGYRALPKKEKYQRNISILLIGSSNVGKSSLCLIMEKPDATVEEVKSIKKTLVIYTKEIKIRRERRGLINYIPFITEIPGDPEISSVSKKEYLKSENDVLIFVVEVAKKDLHYNAFMRNQLLSLREYLTWIDPHTVITSPKMLILYVNKLDLSYPRKFSEIEREFTQYKSFCNIKAKEFGIPCEMFFGSTILNQNLKNLFADIVNCINKKK